jgi:hypothetical protein
MILLKRTAGGFLGAMALGWASYHAAWLVENSLGHAAYAIIGMEPESFVQFATSLGVMLGSFVGSRLTKARVENSE